MIRNANSLCRGQVVNGPRSKPPARSDHRKFRYYKFPNCPRKESNLGPPIHNQQQPCKPQRSPAPGKVTGED
ncbi:jg12352 [Pararge aegeria aegeria]|uniref:Jg12352 protein n=1 Tax=Pararge aegeria aegeria TaxID=348720 RepID=A0A8S4R9U1_9NEOP|nr:jg12352 [Pararge aegeria aegeria]